MLVIRSTFYLQVKVKLFNLSPQESGALSYYIFLTSREHTRALRALANDFVDDLLVLVHGFVVDNGLSEIAIPEIRQGFEQDVSQAHTQITEEYIHLFDTI